MILSKYRKPSKVSKIFVIKDQKKYSIREIRQFIFVQETIFFGR